MKLYVGNLPWSIDQSGLKKLFSSYDVEEATLITDKYSGRSKGFGFVTIADDKEAQKALSEMHQKEIDGRSLTVSEARPMVQRDNSSQAPSGSSSPRKGHTTKPSGTEDSEDESGEDDSPEITDEDTDDED
ncbi:MAG: RNA-binding protein [archaeon]